jgi:2',3'-cyclic-nucleotide 2'-phosphodiesterase/3'-nucleotidase
MTEITILATSDVHGFLSENAQAETGILSLPTIAGQYDDPILIDNGDYLVGSPLATFANRRGALSPWISFANRVGYDVMVPGNHDFDNGKDFLLKQVAGFDGAYLCANAYDLDGQRLFAPYTVIERHGLKVGVIGVITSAMPQISSFDAVKDVVFTDVIETLKTLVPEVSAQADYVVVSYHGGIERDMVTGAPTQYDTGEDQTYRIISEVSGIDAVICGHQHRVNAGSLNGVAFVQPGYRANFVGKLTLGKTRTAELLATADYAPMLEWTNRFPLEAFEAWQTESVDLSGLTDYLEREFQAPYQLVGVKGLQVNDFQASFVAPYTVSMYRLLESEVADVLMDNEITGLELDDHGRVHPQQSDYRILTNTNQLPKHRLETNYVTNVFDAYLSEK